jgi:NTE family protein
MKRIIFILLMLLSVSAFSQRKPRVGIVLSGGGALGFAHVGVLQALEEYGISPGYVAGASMGSLVGAFYANGFSPEEICKIVFKEELYNSANIFAFLSGGKNKLGLSSHKKVMSLLDKYFPTNSFDELSRHLYISATDLTIPEAKVISSGDKLKEYVIASMSIPIIFEAMIIDNHVFVDGGTMDHFPASEIRKDVDVLIGVDVLPFTDKVKLDNVTDMANRLIFLVAQSNAAPKKKLIDYYIESRACDIYSQFDFNKFEEIYRYGYLLAKDYLKNNPEIVSKCTADIHPPKESKPDKTQKKKWYEFWK